MSIAKLSGLLVLLLPLIAWSEPDEIMIPDKFDSVSNTDANAFAFVTKCIPLMRQFKYDDLVNHVTDSRSVISRPLNRTKPFLAINNTRTLCVQVSNTSQPILATEAFDDTITFDAMTAEETKTLRVQLSRQLAQTGVASALVKNDRGNAAAVYYMFVSDTPDKIYYHMSFLKQGEFDESKFPWVTQSSGGVTVKAQGKKGEAQETYKTLFQK